MCFIENTSFRRKIVYFRRKITYHNKMHLYYTSLNKSAPSSIKLRTYVFKNELQHLISHMFALFWQEYSYNKKLNLVFYDILMPILRYHFNHCHHELNKLTVIVQVSVVSWIKKYLLAFFIIDSFFQFNLSVS